MGTILFSAGGEGLYDHEGWLEYRLSEPLVLPPLVAGGEPAIYEGWTTLYATGVDDLRIAVRAGCDCGWRGPESPWAGGEPSDADHDEMMAVWELTHAGPLRDALDAAEKSAGVSNSSVHLHLDDAPAALAILAGLLGHRSDRRALGFDPDEYGAEVDWDLLTTGELSTTEIATVRIAQGIATVERHGGGLPPRVRDAVRAAIENMTGPGR